MQYDVLFVKPFDKVQLITHLDALLNNFGDLFERSEFTRFKKQT